VTGCAEKFDEDGLGALRLLRATVEGLPERTDDSPSARAAPYRRPSCSTMGPRARTGR
jgi:hypothetical protein